MVMLLVPIISTAAELKKETIEAFDRHIANVESRLAPRCRGEKFLWSDQSSQRHQQLLMGTVVVEPAIDKGTVRVKGGLIHDFNGAAFIPGGTLAGALKIAQDFPRHKDMYPEIASALIQAREGNTFHVRTRIVISKFFLSEVVNADQDIEFVNLDATRTFSKAYSRRIVEVVDAGTPKEHELQIGAGRGLLWRLNVYWFFEERDHGVYIECEAVTLTRDMPLGSAKLFAPIVQSVPAEQVRGTMEQTRKAIAAQVKH
jgi:hypothetical protein